jgi:hypothetical protein
VQALKFISLPDLQKALREKDKDGNPIFVERPQVVYKILSDSIFNIFGS